MNPRMIQDKPGFLYYFDKDFRMVEAGSPSVVLAKVVFADGSRTFYKVEPAGLKTAEFNPDQPRDEHGMWTAGGDVYNDNNPVYQRAIAAEKSLRDLGPFANVDKHPNAIRAAEATAAVLTALKAEGYLMPNMLHVITDDQEQIHATVQTHTISGYNGVAPVTERTMRVFVPQNLPREVTLDDAVKKVFGEITDDGPRFVARDFKDILTHEAGHVLSAHYLPPNWTEAEFALRLEPHFTKPWGDDMFPKSRDWFEHVAGQVSQYSRTNPREFVAEAFALQHKGGTLTADAAQLYALLRGPKILPKVKR